jgi:hypothetical protein
MEDGLFKEMQQDAINQRTGVESTDTGRLSNVSDLASKIIQMENKVQFLVKNTISANFGMGEDNLAKDFYQSALDRGFQVDKKEAVHPMTLKSFVKEMTENGSEFPSDLFGAFIGKKAKIVKGK